MSQAERDLEGLRLNAQREERERVARMLGHLNNAGVQVQRAIQAATASDGAQAHEMASRARNSLLAAQQVMEGPLPRTRQDLVPAVWPLLDQAEVAVHYAKQHLPMLDWIDVQGFAQTACEQLAEALEAMRVNESEAAPPIRAPDEAGARGIELN